MVFCKMCEFFFSFLFQVKGGTLRNEGVSSEGSPPEICLAFRKLCFRSSVFPVRLASRMSHV